MTPIHKTLGAGLLLTASILWSDDAWAQNAYRYRLFLTDKPEDSVVQLSQRALDRRERQGIALDDYDRCVSPSYLQALRDAGLVVVTYSRWMNTVVVRRQDGTPIDETEWEQFAFVGQHERITTNETILKPQRKIRDLEAGDFPVINDTPLRQLSELNAVDMIEETPWGEGMLITVVDGGYDGADTLSTLNHHLIGCYDPYRPEDTSYLFSHEVTYHGTHCWSIMSADGSTGFYGSAAMADYYLIRTEMDPSETPLEEDMWIRGVEHADSIGSDLVSSSLGYYEFDDPSYNHFQSQLGTGQVYISQAAEIGTTRGMIICLAAGNEGGSAWGAIDFPSDAQHVIAVGATDSKLNAAYFTSPGFLEPYVKPEVSCRGQNTYYIQPNGKIGSGNGTSYATPLMCGCIATLWSAVPTLTAAQIRDIVIQSGSLYDNPDINRGHGLPDFYLALETARELAGSQDGIQAIASDKAHNKMPDVDLGGRKASGHGLRIHDGKVIFVR